MAEKKAIANGSWNDTETWDNDELPQAGDLVFANGKIVEISTDISVASLRNGNESSIGAVVGGYFTFGNVEDAVVIDAEIYAHTGTIGVSGSEGQVVLINQSDIAYSILGGIYGGGQNSRGVKIGSGVTNVELTVDCEPYDTAIFGGTSTGGYGIDNRATGSSIIIKVYADNNEISSAGEHAIYMENGILDVERGGINGSNGFNGVFMVRGTVEVKNGSLICNDREEAISFNGSSSNPQTVFYRDIEVFENGRYPIQIQANTNPSVKAYDVTEFGDSIFSMFNSIGNNIILGAELGVLPPTELTSEQKIEIDEQIISYFAKFPTSEQIPLPTPANDSVYAENLAEAVVSDLVEYFSTYPKMR